MPDDQPTILSNAAIRNAATSNTAIRNAATSNTAIRNAATSNTAISSAAVSGVTVSGAAVRGVAISGAAVRGVAISGVTSSGPAAGNSAAAPGATPPQASGPAPRGWRWRSFVAGLRHAFALRSPLGPLSREDHALLSKLAGAIVRRGMAAPAILFLGSLRPLGYMGSQAMVFLRPFATLLFKPSDYERLTAILERREGMDALLNAIEAACPESRRETS